MIELELEESRDSFFVGLGSAHPQTFIDVYGALAPLHRNDTVKYLSWKRFDGFRRAMCGCSSCSAVCTSINLKGGRTVGPRPFGDACGKGMHVAPLLSTVTFFGGDQVDTIEGQFRGLLGGFHLPRTSGF